MASAQGKALDSIRYWSQSDFAVGGSDVAGFLLHHCVLEITFDRRYPEHLVIDPKTGRQRVKYRDTRQRTPHTINQNWYGRKRRTMLCTLDETLLRSAVGRFVLNYVEPVGKSIRTHPGNIRVWDIIWQEWREINLSSGVQVKAVIPTSIMPTNSPNGTVNDGPRNIQRQQEILRQILEACFRRMTGFQKLNYLDGLIELNIQDLEAQLRGKYVIEDQKKAEEEELLKQQNKTRVLDDFTAQLMRLKEEFDKNKNINASLQDSKINEIYNTFRQNNNDIEEAEFNNKLDELSRQFNWGNYRKNNGTV